MFVEIKLSVEKDKSEQVFWLSKYFWAKYDFPSILFKITNFEVEKQQVSIELSRKFSAVGIFQSKTYW